MLAKTAAVVIEEKGRAFVCDAWFGHVKLMIASESPMPTMESCYFGGEATASVQDSPN
jgi:hypothetical protein